MSGPIKVLFVCIHNSARSQMAEAYLNHFGDGRFEAESAGLEPAILNPRLVQVMKDRRFNSPLKKPPGEGTGPTIHADFRGNVLGRAPPRGEQDVFEQAARTG